jgi:hypothetical protein
MNKAFECFGSYLFGTLQSETSHASRDYNAGVRLATVDLSWASYEPRDGVFDANYISQMKIKISELKNAGFQVSLGVDLHYAPQWVLNLHNANYINQFGNSTKGPNVVFSQTIRNKAEVYIKRIMQDLGTEFYSVRIGFAPDAGEMLYPTATDSQGNSNCYWAYDTNAQGTGKDLPSGMSHTPFPGWKPGQTTYNGRAFTTAQVDQWYQWYIKSLVQTGDWEQATFKAAGFTRYFAWLLPGSGIRPFDYTREVNNYLGAGVNNTDRNYDTTVATRAPVWNKVIDYIADKRNVQIQISSIADASGNPWANGCQPTDKQVTITDKAIANWSSSRWITYNADRWGLRKTGENPGPHDSVSVMNAAANIMATCHLDAWYYAHDFSLYDGTAGAATINHYANVIQKYNGLPTTATPAPISTHV